MRIELESSLTRWVEARLLDPRQAEGIRAFEAAHAPQQRARWPVIVALAFGGAMLAAGVLLFVSAHWDELSPFYRMSLLVVAVTGFHVGGALAQDRFRALAITLHAAGTVSLGGAIALAGQIFNMQEHWPTAVLLWAAGAAAAWMLLHEWPQVALAAILFPWWLLGEWTEAVSSERLVPAAVLMLAVNYLSLRTGKPDAVRAALAWMGGIALLPAALIVAVEGNSWRRSQSMPPVTLAVGWAAVILLPLAFAYAFRRRAAWINAVAAVWVLGLSVIAGERLELLLYGWCLAGSAGLIAWGIYEYRAERINLGMAAFAITIVFFFFSSVMDKLGRSASLIALGILFVAGGWQWEKLRRRLVSQVRPGGAP
jgi:uncharacterized membrane protein